MNPQQDHLQHGDTQHSRFIEPLDVLFLRGNKLFGDPGSFGECQILPWPSVAAGAIRSRMLADDQTDLNDFAANKIQHPELGTPKEPGAFVLSGFYLAQRRSEQIELLMPPPADLVISKSDADTLSIQNLQPTAITLASSAALPLMPVLAQGNQRSKPVSGCWLTQAGWQTYLQGCTPTTDQLITSANLWKVEPRTGIGMNNQTGSVEEGRLFTTQAVAFQPNVGFIATVQGCNPPQDGLLRLGGDGRSAAIRPASLNLPAVDYAALCHAKRCRLILTSPGLFTAGWRPNGVDENLQLNLPGITAQLVAAAVPRAETLSGWDLANKQPKTAQKIAPTGSVYWLHDLQATPESLQHWVEQGLWSNPCEDPARRAEGFNRFALALVEATATQ